jgi:membrane-associated protein
MEFLKTAFDFVLHLDVHLAQLVQQYGNYIYPLLFLVVFCETGLVITPFLPGDSLLFACGALAGAHPDQMSLPLVMAILFIAPLCGDNANYWLGRWIGTRVAHSRFVKKEYLDRTHAFYEKYGPKTIIIARFVPIVRTFTPFVAGIGRMSYLRFLAFSVLGAALWVGLIVPAGYFLGGLEVVKKNFSIVIMAIIFISLLPALIEFLRAWLARRKSPSSTDA